MYSFWVILFTFSDISFFVLDLSFSPVVILGFYLDDFWTTTTITSHLIFTICENNPYSRPTCWILFLISVGMNWGTLSYYLHFVRKYSGDFTSNSSISFFCYLVYCFPYFFPSGVLSLMSHALYIAPFIKFSYQNRFVNPLLLLWYILLFETTQYQAVFYMSV